MASTVNNTAWLEWISTLMGGVSRQSHAATLPPDRFYCLLDELPLHLIPRHTLESPGWRKFDTADLFLDADCSVCPPGQLPPDFRCSEFLSAFAMSGTIAWVRDPNAGSLLPFWLGPNVGSVVRSLRCSEPVPVSVPGSIRTVLQRAGILVSRDTDTRKKAVHEEMIGRARTLFREKGYAPLPGLIHPFHIAALRRYYRHLIRTGMLQLGDEQSPLRYAVHNETVAQFFHHQITATLSAVAGEQLKPSYVYLASYLSGAELKKHRDREQCEFSITLSLDYSPEPDLESPWPIRLQTSHGTVKVYQMLGDGLAYRGTQLPHYREKLGPGQTSTSIFFHYVSENFQGSLR